jgi:hypothetical protein
LIDRRSWLRPLLQGLGVTASILLALALDAAWDYRQDRVEEASALRRLRGEFEVNAQRYETALAAHRRILEEARALVGAIDRLRGDPSYEAPDSLLANLWNWWTYDPLDGTLNSLIASGRLGLIENDSLRTALASWPDLVADLNEDEGNQRDAVRDHVIPSLAPLVSFRGLLRHQTDEMRLAAVELTSAEKDELLLGGLLENWLVDRIEGKTALLAPGGEMEDVGRELDRIRGLLERELDERR